MITEKERQDIIHARDSERGKYAISFYWKDTDRNIRKERMAVVCYARQVKKYGKDRADKWLIGRFGEEKALQLLKMDVFKKQLTRYS